MAYFLLYFIMVFREACTAGGPIICFIEREERSVQRIQIVIEFHGIIFCMIAAIYLFLKRHQRRRPVKSLREVILLCILLLGFDIQAILYRGDTSRLGWIMVFVSNFAVYLLQILIITGMARYIQSLIELYEPEYRRRWLKLVYGLCILHLIGLALTPFRRLYYYIDGNNIYHRGSFFACSVVLACMILLTELFMIIEARHLLKGQERLILTSCFVCPVAGLVIQVLWYGISFLNIGISVSALLLIVQFEYRDIRLQREQEQVLAQSRAYLLNSQIKPHFIVNCLAVIQALIELDPEAAKDAIEVFSRYMRKSLNLKVAESAIPIKEELDFTESYLYMEQLRFGDQLDVIYDIDDSLNFKIPF